MMSCDMVVHGELEGGMGINVIYLPAYAIAALLFLCVLGPGGAAASKQQPIVAVFDIQAKLVDVRPKVVSALSDYLAARLAAKGTFQVVPRQKLRRRLRRQKRASYEHCYARSCQIEIGREVAAEKSMATLLIRIGSKCVVTATLYDLKRAATEQNHTVESVCTNEGILASITLVAEKFITRSAHRVPAVPPGVRSTTGQVVGQVGDGDARRVTAPGRDMPTAWREDFSSCAIGDPVSRWGRNLTVVRGPGDRMYMSSQIPGRHPAGHWVNMGRYFVFEFDWTSFDYRRAGTVAPWVRVPISLRDRQGRTFRLACGNWGLKLPGRPNTDFSERSLNRFRLERRGDHFKFFNNGRFLASGVFPGYAKFVSFQIEIPVKASGEGQRFGGFRVTPLLR